METLKLKNPIMINGEKVAELTYDINEIDGLLFSEAEAKHKSGVKGASISPAAEFDFGLHLYLGYAAVIAVNPGYDFADLERIKGADVREVLRIGRSFMLQSDESQEESSEEPTETTPESITPVKPISRKKE